MKRIFTLIALLPACVSAEQFNTQFLQGVSDVPAVFDDSIRFPAGQYYVDVCVNGDSTGRMMLSISKEEQADNVLCLSPEWLREAGVLFTPSFYEETFDRVRGCYRLTRAENTSVVFTQGTQVLDFSLPQAWLLKKTDPTLWDEGITGLRLSYDGNFNQNIQQKNRRGNKKLDAYGGLRAALNIGGWVLKSDMNATRYNERNQFMANSVTLTRPIGALGGDFTLGHAQTRNQLFSDFSFDGIALASNDNMRPQETRGYAPVINGVAASQSRVTISQGGLHSALHRSPGRGMEN